MDYYKKVRLTSWLVASLVAIAVFCLTFFLRALYTLTGACDACFFASVAVFAVLLIYIVERSGTFDVFNYQFLRFFESFRPDGIKKWDTAYDYKLDKEKKRKTTKVFFLPYLIVGGAFFLAATILLIIVEISLHS